LAQRGGGLVGRRERALAVAGLVGVVAFVATPGTAAGPDGDPVQFALNLRYLTPELALGLALLPRLRPLGAPRRQLWTAGALALLLLLCQRTQTILPSDHRAVGVAGALVVIAAVAGIVVLARRRPQPLALAGTVAAVAIVALAGGWTLQKRYLTHRYTDFAALGPELSTWARAQHHQRIGVVGTGGGFSQYPLYGIDLSNRVRYIAHHGAHGGFTTITRCAEWRAAVDAGRYDYVLITPHVDLWTFAPLSQSSLDESTWVHDPAAHVVLDYGSNELVRLSGPLDVHGCPAGA
ncbi:MAG: hypothetical protein JWN32_845, partial [Solirubrobacterales bacterium]|nr:hypothetical protein [Solirubrobacterales bacterium]